MNVRSVLLLVFSFMAGASVAQKTCFDAANAYRTKYLEQTSIDFDSLTFYLEKGQNMLIGCTFPNDTFTTIKNKKHSIDQYKGKALVINFWSIHCPPCINEIPSFHELQKKFKDLVVLAFTLDNPKEITNYLKSHAFKAEIIADARDFTHNYSLGNGLPFTIVVDPAGKIIYVKSGGKTGTENQLDLYKELSPTIEKALKRG